ncbi:hypothetical protein Tco_0936984 [Tanacetum coccineum]|uniref:Uncharacterized protein n=1 Tax=Tanacetum coccineum TaxID=301880 RepID=A0ABQ5DJY4_9ASTR
MWKWGGAKMELLDAEGTQMDLEACLKRENVIALRRDPLKILLKKDCMAKRGRLLPYDCLEALMNRHEVIYTIMNVSQHTFQSEGLKHEANKRMDVFSDLIPRPIPSGKGKSQVQTSIWKKNVRTLAIEEAYSDKVILIPSGADNDLCMVLVNYRWLSMKKDKTSCVLMPRVVKSRDEIFSRWGYCDNRGLSRLHNQSIERDRLIGIGFVLDFVEFISFTFGDKEMILVIEAVSR